MNHQCEEMEREIKKRGEPIIIAGYAVEWKDKTPIAWKWWIDLVSTDDHYISAGADIQYCPFCGVKFE